VAGYTRQSSADIIATAVVRANPLNVEYNALRDAFNASTGHKHDGTAAEGAYVPLIADSDALNKVAIDTSNNRVGVFVEVSSAAVEQIRIQDGAVVPVTNNDIDLGTSSLQFKDLFIDGTATVDALQVDANAVVTGNLTVNGNTTLGNAASDTVTVTADVASPLLPSADDTHDLGAVGSEWRNLYIDGTANIDALVADTADINGGTVDGAVIGGASAAAITGTTITGTSFVIGSANINEADLETIDDLTAGTVAASKAIVVDSNKDFTGARNITITGELDAATLDISGDVDVDGTLETDALSINGTAVTATAAELNTIDGNTSATSTTLADADRFVVNDNGTMKQVALPDLTTYLGGNLGILSSVTAVGALNSGSITSGFGSIDTGSSTITTTGNITGGNIIISDGGNIGSASDTDAIAIASGGNVTVSQDLIVSGNLTVSGTQTVVDTVTINAQNAIVFEGATADNNETTLTIVDPTADRTISLPNQSGTVPVLAAASNTAITATPAELNIIDGNTSATSTTVADGDRVIMNDNGTMVQVAVTDLAAYFDDEITAMPNLVTTAATTVGALNSGSITSGFGAIDNGSSAITTTGTITGGTVSYGNLTDGSITITAFVDEDNMSSNSATLIPTQQSVKAYVDTVASTSNNVTGLNATGAELNTVADFSAVSVDTSTAIANNDAILMFDNGNEIGYRDVDLLDTYFSSTTKTLTNKTLTSPTVSGLYLSDSGFTVEGSSADGNETTVAFTNPSADRTITFPNATGTVALSNSSSATFGGDGSSGGVTLQDGRIDIRTGTGSVAAIRFYCESSNAHYTELKSAAHSAYSGNLSFVLPAADGSSGQFLKTDGSGNLAFAAVPASIGGSTGVDFNDDIRVRFGAGNDLQIYHDSSTNKSHITESGSSHLVIQGQEIQFDNASGTSLLNLSSSQVELLHNGNQKLTTESGGINVIGRLQVSNASNSAGSIKFLENSSNGSNAVTLAGPESTSDITFTLPSADGSSGQFLKTDGSGNLAFADASATTFFGASEGASNATDSTAIGSKAKSDVIGKLAYSTFSFAGLAGQAQQGLYVLVADTTDATATVMTTNNSSASTDNQIILKNDSAMTFHGTIVARQEGDDGTDCAGWKIEGLIRREGAANTTTLLTEVVNTYYNAPNWDVSLTADTTNGGLKVEITGAASHDVRWVGTINTSELDYETYVWYGTRGVFAGGYDSGGNSNVIDYITISSTGNATDFGDLTVARNQSPASMSNGTRGVFAGGRTSSAVNTIDYITVASTGNAIDFGDLTVGRMQSAGASNGVKGLIIAGNSSAIAARTDVDKLTIATTGNATLYSGTTGSAQSCTGWSNGDRAVFAIGYSGSAKVNTVEFLSIETEGNATDFGDLTVARNNHSATGSATRMLVVGGDT